MVLKLSVKVRRRPCSNFASTFDNEFRNSFLLRKNIQKLRLVFGGKQLTYLELLQNLIKHCCRGKSLLVHSASIIFFMERKFCQCLVTFFVYFRKRFANLEFFTPKNLPCAFLELKASHLRAYWLMRPSFLKKSTTRLHLTMTENFGVDIISEN